MTFFANIFNRNAHNTAAIATAAAANRKNIDEISKGNNVGRVVESHINNGKTLYNAMKSETKPQVRNALRSLYAAINAYVQHPTNQRDHIRQAIRTSQTRLAAMHVHVSDQAIRELIDGLAKKQPATKPTAKKLRPSPPSRNYPSRKPLRSTRAFRIRRATSTTKPAV